MTIQGTTTPSHANDDAKGTKYDFSESNGFKKYFDENSVTEATVNDALNLIGYSSIQTNPYATETSYGIVRLASFNDMDNITVNGDADNILNVVTVQDMQYWVNNVAPATTTSNGFVTLASTSQLTRSGSGYEVITISDLNAFLNDPANSATLTQTGGISLASIAECNAGTNATKAVTPQSLRQIVDSAVGGSAAIEAETTVLGNVYLANNSESINGSDTQKAITPYTNKSAFDSWIAQWWADNNNSLTVAGALQSLIGQEANFPPSIETAPAGWVAKNGAMLSRDTYPLLWQWVQDNNLYITETEWQQCYSESVTGAVSVYSSGDQATTFRLPTIGTMSGFAKSLAPDDISNDINKGFTSSNKYHVHSVENSGSHTHVNNSHKHTATFNGNPLPDHTHNVPRDTYGHGNTWALVQTSGSDESMAPGYISGTSAGTPTGVVDVHYASTVTMDAAGDHQHVLGYDGSTEATPVGFYVKTFIFASVSTDVLPTPTPDWLAQQNTNTMQIAELGATTGAPIGSIIAYDSSDLSQLPSNWVICDGTNGTPDMRGRFIVGEDPNSDPSGDVSFKRQGNTGGKIDYNHNHSGTVQGHTLSVSEIPMHKHEFTGDDRLANTGGYFKIIQQRVWETESDGTDDGPGGPKVLTNKLWDNNNRQITSQSAHTHNMSMTPSSAEIAPPYYVVVYIKRIA